MNAYAVWYMRPEFFRDGVMGADWLRKAGKLPDPAALERTHVHLLNAEAADLERLWFAMQAEQWSPNGEARHLIELHGLAHTSMSVGDIAVDLATGQTFLVDSIHFTEIKP